MNENVFDGMISVGILGFVATALLMTLQRYLFVEYESSDDDDDDDSSKPKPEGMYS